MKSSPDQPTVFVVDDDNEFRESIRLLLASVKLKAETFASAQAFLDSDAPRRPGCLVVDVRMPGMSGLELQKWLVDHDIQIPTIIVTAHAEVPMAVEAMRAGAVDFLQKPYSPQQLLERIQHSLEMDAKAREELAAREKIRQKLAALSPREREVMDQLLQGKNAKEIAHQLNLSTKTVEFHRRNLMEKMDANSLIDLASMIAPPKTGPGG